MMFKVLSCWRKEPHCPQSPWIQPGMFCIVPPKLFNRWGLGKPQKNWENYKKNLEKPQKNWENHKKIWENKKKNFGKTTFPCQEQQKAVCFHWGFFKFNFTFFSLLCFLRNEATTSAFLGCKIPFYSLCCGIEGIFSSSRPEICYLSFFFWTASLASLSLSSCAHSSEKKKIKEKIQL